MNSRVVNGGGAETAVMAQYLNMTPELEKRVQKSKDELCGKYGCASVGQFFEAALRLGAINTRLRDEAIAKAEGFVSSGVVNEPDFEARMMEAANAINYALAHTTDKLTIEIYVGMFDETVLKIDGWQLWHLGDYAAKAGDPMILYFFVQKLKEMGGKPVDYGPLVEMAGKVGPEKAPDVFEGRSPDSAEWLREAAKEFDMSSVFADHIIDYLQTLVNVLAGKIVGIVPRGDGFATDGQMVLVPLVYGRYPTKIENEKVYTHGTYHAAKHISAHSFVVNALQLDLKAAGCGFKVLGKEEDGIKVFKLDNPSKEFIAKTTTDLLGMFENRVLARALFDIIEDRRVDGQVVRDNPGLADEYEEGIQRMLSYRPTVGDATNPAHVLEALAQLMIAGRTRDAMPPRLRHVVTPLVERVRVISPESPDATESFHATIDVYNMLVSMFPILKMPKVIPLPKEWNEDEDHSEIGAPIVVRVKAEDAGIGFPIPGEGGEGGEEGEDEGAGEGKGKGKKGEEKDEKGGGEEGGEEGEDEGAGKEKGKKGEEKDEKGGGEEGGEEDEEDEDEKKGGKEKKGKERKGREQKSAAESNLGDPYGNPWQRGRALKEPTNAPKIRTDGKDPGGGLKATTGELFGYPQWDYEKGVYIPNWVCVRENRVAMGPGFRGKADGVKDVVNAVKTAFLVLKPAELKKIHGLPEGDEVDVERLVQWTVDAEFEAEREEDFCIQMKRVKRSVVCALLVDASGSTKYRLGTGQTVIQVENDACEAFSAAADAVGDRYGIFAFDSNSNEDVRIYVAKEFDEETGGRPSFYSGGWTREGAAIRHMTKKLEARKEKKKVMIIINDGNPMDLNEYQGRYAIEDTKKAVEEAVRKRILVFCIAIRPAGDDVNLKEIYGSGRVRTISKIQELPLVLPHMYQILTGLG